MSRNGYVKTNIKDNILLEEVPNPDINIYHIKTKIMDSNTYDIKNVDIIKTNPKIKLHENIECLLKSIIDVPGVIEITVKKYSIRVTKGKAFNWETDEVHDKICKILEDFQR